MRAEHQGRAGLVAQHEGPRVAHLEPAPGMALASILQSYQLVTLGILAVGRQEALNDANIRECWPLWLDYVDRATGAAADAYVVT